MGGFGSGRYGGWPTVESALRLDIGAMMRWGCIRPGAHLQGEMTLHFTMMTFKSNLNLTYVTPGIVGFARNMTSTTIGRATYTTSTTKCFWQPLDRRSGGLRWWFVCPRLNRRVRKLYLPLGGRHFRSRHAYHLPYSSQRETVHDRAMRRARKLCLRLGGDPADDTYPNKPKRMRWTTYNRLMDELVAADGVADERLLTLAPGLIGRKR
jgi:hypothetical protein